MTTEERLENLEKELARLRGQPPGRAPWAARWLTRLRGQPWLTRAKHPNGRLLVVIVLALVGGAYALGILFGIAVVGARHMDCIVKGLEGLMPEETRRRGRRTRESAAHRWQDDAQPIVGEAQELLTDEEFLGRQDAPVIDEPPQQPRWMSDPIVEEPAARRETPDEAHRRATAGPARRERQGVDGTVTVPLRSSIGPVP